MTDPQWYPIATEFRSACDHFSNAVQIFERARFDAPGLDGYVDSMAFMHAMQAGHTDLENGLLRILSLVGEDHPRDKVSWHGDLLKQVSIPIGGRPAVLPPDVAEHAQETRRFRNVAVRSYNRLVGLKARPAVNAARILAKRLPQCLRDFRGRIDPPEPPRNDGGGDGSEGGVGGGPR